MKYKLTTTTKTVNGVALYQIQALEDFSNVKKGDLGGWIQSEKNLSQEGMCWVYDKAQVWGRAHVSGNARVWGNAQVYDKAQVWGSAQVSGNAQVLGNAQVSGEAQVLGNA